MKRIRWKTLLAGLALLCAGLICVRVIPAIAESQYRSILAMACPALAVLWFAVWTAFLSNLRRRNRAIWLAAAAAALGTLAALVRIDGYEGDNWPQLSWIWEPRPGEIYDALELDSGARRAAVPGALDSPEFLGPGRSNRAPTSALPARWFEVQPRELWRRKVGLGWSSFAVAGGLAITQEQRGDEECTVAYALESGVAVWAHRNPARFAESMGGDGPRATPTIAGGRILALGATGILDCLELDSGALRWSREVLAENGHANLTWGKSCSPLLVGDLVIVTLGQGPGGALAAFDLASGTPRWRAGDFEASYGSPILGTLSGLEQIVVVYADRVAGHRVETGAVLWSAPLPKPPAIAANPAILSEDRVLVSIGYGKGSRLLQISCDEAGNWSAEQVWRSLSMKPKFCNLVIEEPHAYSLDEGILACVDLRTGRRVWKGTRWGHGQVLGIGDHLLIQAESGEVAITERTAAGERISMRFAPLTSKTWNQPVLAGRYLLVRNDREAACYQYE